MAAKLRVGVIHDMEVVKALFLCRFLFLLTNSAYFVVVSRIKYLFQHLQQQAQRFHQNVFYFVKNKKSHEADRLRFLWRA